MTDSPLAGCNDEDLYAWVRFLEQLHLQPAGLVSLIRRWIRRDQDARQLAEEVVDRL